MGCANGVGHGQQGMAGAKYRLFLEHVDGRQTWPSGCKCRFKRTRRHQFGATGVYDQGVRLHERKVGGSDQSAGLGIEPDMQADDIAAGKERFTRWRRLETIGTRVSHGTLTPPDPHLHAERMAIAGHHLADSTVAPDTEGPTTQLPAQ